MKCPTCGAENDAANRFCDQCGTKLDAASASAPVAAPVMAATSPSTCPNCGASVLPGEAFCDDCGAPLAAAPVVSAAPATEIAPVAVAPVVVAPAPDMGNQAAASATVACPACGHGNLPGDSFCENCGASLGATPTAADTTTIAPVTDVAVPVEVVPDQGSPVPLEDDDQNQAPPAADQFFPAQPAAQAAPVAPAAQAVPAQEAAPVQSDADAERQRLTEEIARQDMLIAQFEQMQSMFGANTPPAVVQGLADAQAARAQAETALAAVAPAASTVDPAELARLQEEIARQEQVIAQFGQMQSMFGANTPPAVTQGLADAQTARDQATAALAALTGGATPAPVATPAAPVASTPIVEATLTPASAPEATPAVKGPRLVVEAGGAEIPLVLNKAELIIGREDPISGIFPEVDLTPFGGEGGGVSRQHAKLLNNNGQWSLVDLNSTNYTRVDGTKLEPNTPTAINSGARIQLGRIVVVFQA